jgi:hypothetical protein
MQGGVEGSMFDLQDILGPSLDRMRYGVSVSGAQNQRLQDQHVQRSLKHFALQRRLASWHLGVYSTRSSTGSLIHLYAATLIWSRTSAKDDLGELRWGALYPALLSSGRKRLGNGRQWYWEVIAPQKIRSSKTVPPPPTFQYKRIPI